MMNQLHAIELEELESVDLQSEEVKQRFKLENLDSLNWAFRKLSALQAQKREIQQLAQAEMDRIHEWEEAELKSIQNTYDFFTSLVTEYHSTILAGDPDKKTIATPYGKAKSRLSKEAPDKVNEEQMLEHIKSSGMTEYIKESLKWGDFKKKLKIAVSGGKKFVVDENGEAVPGAIVKPESVTFSVEVK